MEKDIILIFKNRMEKKSGKRRIDLNPDPDLYLGQQIAIAKYVFSRSSTFSLFCFTRIKLY